MSANSREDEEFAELLRGGESSDFWFLNDEEYIAKRALERVGRIEDANAAKFSSMQMYVKLYQGRMPVTMDKTGINAGEDSPAVLAETGAVPKHNLVRSNIDAWWSLVGKQRPRPRLLSTGGSWKAHMLVQDLNNFLTGAITMSDLYEVAPDALRDSAICGTGVVRWLEDESVSCERLLPWQVIVDEELCATSRAPVEVFVRTPEHIKSVCYQYPEKREQIMAFGNRINAGRQVMVYEGWYLGKDCPVYVKFVGDVLLDTYSMKDRRLPLQFLFYSKQPSGFYGIGLAEMLLGAQMRIDEIQYFIAEMQRKHLRPTTFVDGSAGAIQMSTVEGLDMRIVSLPGGMKPPVVNVPAVISPDLYREVERIADASKTEHGISNAATNNQLPAGIDSAPAQREYNFKDMDRHNRAAVRYETFFVEAGHHLIEGYQRIAKSGRKRPKVAYSDRSSVDFIEWPKINLKEMAYTIQLQASPLDSLSPANRMQTVLEMGQYGFFSSPAEMRQLLGNPDLEASDMYSPTAFVADASWTIDKLMRGWNLTPDPIQQMSELIPRVRAAALVVKKRGTDNVTGEMDEDAQTAYDNLTRFLDEAIMLEQQAQAAMAPPAGTMPQGGQPTDEGMPTANLSRPAAQGLNAPSSGGGKSSQGI